MGATSGASIVRDGLIFAYDIGSKKSWKGKPTTNLVPSGQRTCSSGLQRMSAHVQSYSYESGVEAYGRKDTIKATIVPSTTNPYADYGFQVFKPGGSEVGDVYWVSFEYRMIKGGRDPSGLTAYANGYKNPSSANVATLSNVTVEELPDGWKRWSAKVTLTAAGNTWWRFGQNSNSEHVEFYLDNFQVIHSDVDAPFVDGTRDTDESLLDWVGGRVINLGSSVEYDSEGDFKFDGTNNSSYASFSALNINNRSYSVECWFNADSVNRTQGVLGDYQYNWWSFNVSSSNRVSVFHKETSALGGSGVTSNQTILPNTWYQAVMTFDIDVGMSLYINGELDNYNTDTQPFYPSTTTRGPQYIGHYRGGAPTSPDVFDGKVGIIRVYRDKALTPSEVQCNFESTRSRYSL